MKGDLLPLIITEVKNKSKHLKFNTPLRLVPQIISRYLTVENSGLGIYVYAPSRAELIKELEDQILMLWEEYVEDEVNEFTMDAQQLRYNLLTEIKEVGGR